MFEDSNKKLQRELRNAKISSLCTHLRVLLRNLIQNGYHTAADNSHYIVIRH
jgi:hypothetical protein